MVLASPRQPARARRTHPSVRAGAPVDGALAGAPVDDALAAEPIDGALAATPIDGALAGAPVDGARAGDAMAVDVALVLAIDVSGSVSEDRMMLQRQGYSDALRHPGFLEAVRSGPTGRVALTFVQWSEARRQDQSVAWRVIEDAATARQFADAITAADRPMPGWTSISAAIDFSARLIAAGGFTAGRKVIDVSGDGSNNDGREVTAARDDAVAAGITVNGLPIIEIEPRLDDYYRRNVIGGPDAFVVVARDIGAFADAMLRKLLVELAYASPAVRQRAGPGRDPGSVQGAG
jgi:hypothetical protein